MPIYRATVTYIRTPKTGNRLNRIKTHKWPVTTQGRTESAVLAAVRKLHPDHEIEILEINWK